MLTCLEVEIKFETRSRRRHGHWKNTWLIRKQRGSVCRGGGGSGIRKINKKSKAVVLNKPWFGSRGSELLVVRDSEGVYLLDDVDVSRPAKLGPEIGSCN